MRHETIVGGQDEICRNLWLHGQGDDPFPLPLLEYPLEKAQPALIGLLQQAAHLVVSVGLRPKLGEQRCPVGVPVIIAEEGLQGLDQGDGRGWGSGLGRV